MGEKARSKMDSGEAGSMGEAMGKPALGLGSGGGKRKGLCGDNGEVSGSGVSGSQYDRGGTGGMSRSVMPGIMAEAVPSRGKVERRGVGGRGARQWVLLGIDIWREFARGCVKGITVSHWWMLMPHVRCRSFDHPRRCSIKTLLRPAKVSLI